MTASARMPLIHAPGVGFEVVMSTPQASAARLKSEGEKWARVIRAAGIKAE